MRWPSGLRRHWGTAAMWSRTCSGVRGGTPDSQAWHFLRVSSEAVVISNLLFGICLIRSTRFTTTPTLRHGGYLTWRSFFTAAQLLEIPACHVAGGAGQALSVDGLRC